MTKKMLFVCGAALAACFQYASATQAATMVAGTFVTDSSTASSAPTAATSTSTAPGDAVKLQISNDATDLILYVTYDSTVTIPTQLFVVVDTDNNPSTGYQIFGSTLIGANLGFQNDFPFTETASNFNSNGLVTSASSSAAGTPILTQSPFGTPTTTELITIALDTTQADLSTGGFIGPDFPGTFTLETFQNDGNVVGPVEYTLGVPVVSTPEPASLSLLILGIVPLVQRRHGSNVGR